MLPALVSPLVALTAVLSAVLSALGPPGSPSPGAAAWVAPVAGPVVVLRDFDPPSQPWLPGHRGVDLDADVGDPVLAAGAGTITWAASIGGRGVVVVEHADGRRTTYEPVEPSVTFGDTVAAGTPIGVLTAGAGHCGGAPSCLHWGLRREEDYLDPMLLLRRGRPVLLP